MPTTGPMGIAVNLINFAYLTSILVVAALMARRYGQQSPEQRRRSCWRLPLRAAVPPGADGPSVDLAGVVVSFHKAEF